MLDKTLIEHVLNVLNRGNNEKDRIEKWKKAPEDLKIQFSEAINALDCIIEPSLDIDEWNENKIVFYIKDYDNYYLKKCIVYIQTREFKFQ